MIDIEYGLVHGDLEGTDFPGSNQRSKGKAYEVQKINLPETST